MKGRELFEKKLEQALNNRSKPIFQSAEDLFESLCSECQQTVSPLLKSTLDEEAKIQLVLDQLTKNLNQRDLLAPEASAEDIEKLVCPDTINILFNYHTWLSFTLLRLKNINALKILLSKDELNIHKEDQLGRLPIKSLITRSSQSHKAILEKIDMLLDREATLWESQEKFSESILANIFLHNKHDLLKHLFENYLQKISFTTWDNKGETIFKHLKSFKHEEIHQVFLDYMPQIPLFRAYLYDNLFDFLKFDCFNTQRTKILTDLILKANKKIDKTSSTQTNSEGKEEEHNNYYILRIIAIAGRLGKEPENISLRINLDSQINSLLSQESGRAFIKKLGRNLAIQLREEQENKLEKQAKLSIRKP